MEKREIIKSIVSQFRPELYVKGIKCGFKTNDDGSKTLIVQYTLDNGTNPPSNNQILSWTRELAYKIRSATSIPISFTQTTVEYK